MIHSQVESDTIDMNQLVRRALRGLFWVLLISAAVGGITFFASRYLPDTYEATVVIEVKIPPVVSLYGTSLVGARLLDPDLRTVPSMAQEAKVIDRAYAMPALAPFAGPSGEFNHPRSALSVTAVNRTAWQLRVRGRDREQIKALAGAWAQAAVERIDPEFGISNQGYDVLMARSAEALENWEAVYSEWLHHTADDFAKQQLAADVEVARNMYIALTQAAQQAKLSNETSRGAVRIQGPAEVLSKPVQPQPLRYAIVAGLLVFTIGLFALLVVELVRLDR